MKKLFGGTSRTRFTAVASAFTCLIILATSVGAAELKEARVTQVVSDVKLLPQQAAPRPAVVNDPVRAGTAVRTGTQSRSELTFNDLTITRLGANTIFSFNEGTRELNLIDGAILFQLPKGSGGATIKTAAVTAAITGTTGMGEFHPAKTSNALPFSKWLGLEGTFRLILPNGQSVELGPGKMVTTDGKSFSKVQSFNIGQVMKTARLVNGYDTSLPSEVLALIALEIQKQLISGLVGITTQNPLDLTNVLDIISQGIDAQEIVQQPPTEPPPPPPPPSEFGPPSVITSPVPYLITSSTVITTDPTITTNGVTDFGTIYRGPTQDGPFSVFLFGSTSAFDLALKYDVEFFADPNNLPIAVFKFQSLSLIGNPIINLGTGGITKLGLVGVDGITSGPPGGTLTFSGLDGLLLATQAGSINLTSDVSFQNIDMFVAYARGAGSNLTLASPILNSNVVVLAAEGSMHLELGITVANRLTFQTGGDLISTGSGKFTVDNTGGTIADGGKIRFKVGGDLSSQDLSLLVENTAGGHINTGGNIHLTIAGNLVASGDANFTIQNTTGTINDGGNINLEVGGNLTINGGGDLTLIVGNDDGGFIGHGGNISVTTGGNLFTQGLILIVTNYGDVFVNFNNPGAGVGHIGTGGNIFVTTGGNLATDYIDAFIDNHNGASIGSGATISFDIGGALTTKQNPPASPFPSAVESLSFIISNVFSNASAGTIGSDATISLTAGSVSAGGALNALISNRPAPAMIGGSAIINFDVAGNLHADDYAQFLILDQDVFNVGHGGTIKGDALIDVSAANISTGQDLDFIINNKGTVGAGGTINGNATINVTANNISTGGPLDAEIDNSKGGHIGGKAAINVDVSGDINIQNDATFDIDNGSGSGGGTIGSDAVANVSASNLSAGYLESIIFNRGGNIGGSATVNFDVSGDINTSYAALIITNRNGGTIGSNATIDVTAASISTGFLNPVINNNAAGVIHGNATNAVNVTGDINATDGFYCIIADTGFQNTDNTYTGGQIDGNATVVLHGQNIITLSTASGTIGVDEMALEAAIYPNVNGTVGGNAAVSVTALQDISAPGTALFWVANGNYQSLGPGTIGGSAIVNVNAANIFTGDLFLLIENFDGSSIGGNAILNLTALNSLNVNGSLDVAINNPGGTIGGKATINMNVSGNADITNDATVAIYGSDPAGSAAINFNGGSYNVGTLSQPRTFLSTIDGDGTITFNNASVHADVLKVGAFGPNGVLKIGGGTLSADTTLKLYAPGSNGQLNFVSNVTLGGNSMKILAADSVTIFNGVVVTIGGTYPADVYTNNANYAESSGGNDSTTGTFAGAGANPPQPLPSAPPFNDTFSHTTATTSNKGTSSSRISDSNLKTTSGKKTGSEINVSSSEQLLAMLDGATPSPGGKITVPASKSTSNLKNSSGSNAAGRLNAGPRAADTRDGQSLLARRFLP